MASLQEELSKSLYLYTSGSSIEAVRGEDGITRVQVVEPISGGGVAAEDQTDPFAIAGPVAEMGVGEFLQKTGETMAGAIGGAGAVTAGFPGDIIGLGEGLYGAATAEEGQRIDSFLQNMAARSEQMGSALTIGALEDFIQQSDLAPDTKENMLAGSKYLGEWAELPGGLTAASALMRGARRAAGGIMEPGAPPAMAPDVPSAVGVDVEAGSALPSFETTKIDFETQLNRGDITPEMLESHPHVENTFNDMMERPTTEELPGYGTPEFRQSRQFDLPGVVGYENAIEHLHNHARGFAWTDSNMPVPENPVKFEKKAVIIVGPPAAGKSTLANPIARSIGASIIDADEAKKIIPGYDNGVGANVVHEESSTINKAVLKSAQQTGENIVLPIVGGRADKLREQIQQFKDAGYRVTLMDMAVEPDEALMRMYSRFASKDRLIPPVVAKVGRGPSEAYDVMEKEGIADAYTRIDNNPGRGQPRIVIRDDDGIIEQAGIDFRTMESNRGQGRSGSKQPRRRRNGTKSVGQNDASQTGVEPDITVTYPNEAVQ